MRKDEKIINVVSVLNNKSQGRHNRVVHTTTLNSEKSDTRKYLRKERKFKIIARAKIFI